MSGYGSRVRVSAKVDYALRAMLELASAGGLVKGEQIATAQGIPQKFLETILLDLRHAELVTSRRGVEGGYALARPAEEISLADVIRAVEGPIATVRGVRPDDVVKSASTIKLAVLLEGFHQIDAGQKRLDDALTLKPEDQVPGSAVLAHLRAPATITFQDALTFMVIVSDNTAMNLAIDHVGLARVNARLSQLGLQRTRGLSR